MGRMGCAIVALALLAMALEGGLRATGYLPAMRSDHVGVTGYFWVCDRVLGFRNRPNGEYRYEEIRTLPYVTTDEDGYRKSYGWETSGESPIVLFLGDSIVFGAEVNDEETIPSYAAKMMRPRTDVRVLNAGVRGYNTVQCKRMLQMCLQRHPNVRLVVYAYCGNDWFENLDGAIYLPAKAPFVRVSSDGRVQEVDVEDPPVAWGQSFLSAADKRAKRPPKRWDRRVRDRLRERSVLYHYVQTKISALKERGGGDDTPGAAASGVPKELDNSESLRTGGTAMIALLRDMKAMCDERGIAFLVTIPSIDPPPAAFLEWFREAGSQFVPLHESVDGNRFEFLARRREGQYDSHYNAHGSRAFAEALAPTLLQALEAGAQTVEE